MLKKTLPVAVPVPMPEIVAVNVTFSPKTDGLWLLVRASADVARTMVMLDVAELPVWLASPAKVYDALHPLAKVTSVQLKPPYVGVAVVSSPTPVTVAVAVYGVPLYGYGAVAGFQVIVTVDGAFVIDAVVLAAPPPASV